jgi:hypothetical protein
MNILVNCEERNARNPPSHRNKTEVTIDDTTESTKVVSTTNISASHRKGVWPELPPRPPAIQSVFSEKKTIGYKERASGAKVKNKKASGRNAKQTSTGMFASL